MAFYQKGYDAAVANEDIHYQNIFLVKINMVHAWQNGPESITEDMERFNRNCAKIDDYRVKAVNLRLLGYMASRMGEPEKAIAHYSKARDQFKKLYDKTQIANCNINLAKHYYLSSQYALSIETLEKALRLYEESENFDALSEIWEIRGDIYRDVSLLSLSQQSYSKALEYAEINKDLYRLNDINYSIRKLDAQQASPQIAAQIYRDWIAACKAQPIKSSPYNATLFLAIAYKQLGDYEKAMSTYLDALTLAENYYKKIHQCWALRGIASVNLKLGNTSLALDQYKHVLKLATESNISRLIADIYLELGIYFEETGNISSAIEHYKMSIGQFENVRDDLKASEFSIGFLSTRQKMYERLSECYFQKFIKEQDPQLLDSLYKYEEMTHARSLKDEMAQYIKLSNSDSKSMQKYDTLCEHYQNIQWQLRQERNNPNNTVLDSLLTELEILKYNLITEKIQLSLELEIEKTTRALPRLETVQKKLSQQTTLMYHLTDRLSYALVIQADSVKAILLPCTRTEIDSLIDEVLSPFHNVKSDSVLYTAFKAQIAHTLYELLFEPITKKCSLDSQIFIVPSHSLARLPFDMLLEKKPQHTEYLPTEAPVYAGDFLGSHYSFYYGPSTHILLREPLHCSHNMLILANPYSTKDRHPVEKFTLRMRTGWRFDPLIFAEAEAKAIKRFCKGAKILRREKATEKTLTKIASQFGIIHIASHAFVDTTFDTFSGLALAAGKRTTNDGLLMGFEIAESDFSCDLVTLSACETGRGSLIKGEGVLGLPRQFLASGTRSVIMSQWKVDDEFTAGFFPDFYKNYLQKGFSKVHSLQEAKRSVFSDQEKAHVYYQHPFFWAAFNLYGDAGGNAGSENLAPVVNKRDLRYYLILFAGVLVITSLIIFIFWNVRKRVRG